MAKMKQKKTRKERKAAEDRIRRLAYHMENCMQVCNCEYSKKKEDSDSDRESKASFWFSSSCIIESFCYNSGDFKSSLSVFTSPRYSQSRVSSGKSQAALHSKPTGGLCERSTGGNSCC